MPTPNEQSSTAPTPGGRDFEDPADRVRAAVGEENWRLVLELSEINERGWRESVKLEARCLIDHIATAFPDREEAIRAVGAAFLASGGHEDCQTNPGRRFHP